MVINIAKAKCMRYGACDKLCGASSFALILCVWTIATPWAPLPWKKTKFKKKICILYVQNGTQFSKVVATRVWWAMGR